MHLELPRSYQVCTDEELNLNNVLSSEEPYSQSHDSSLAFVPCSSLAGGVIDWHFLVSKPHL